MGQSRFHSPSADRLGRQTKPPPRCTPAAAQCSDQRRNRSIGHAAGFTAPSGGGVWRCRPSLRPPPDRAGPITLLALLPCRHQIRVPREPDAVVAVHYPQNPDGFTGDHIQLDCRRDVDPAPSAPRAHGLVELAHSVRSGSPTPIHQAMPDQDLLPPLGLRGYRPRETPEREVRDRLPGQRELLRQLGLLPRRPLGRLATCSSWP